MWLNLATTQGPMLVNLDCISHMKPGMNDTTILRGKDGFDIVAYASFDLIWEDIREHQNPTVNVVNVEGGPLDIAALPGQG